MQQPQYLIAPVILESITLRFQRRCIVTSNFLVAEALWPGSDHIGVAEELHGDEASRVVRAHWAHNDEGFGLCDARESKPVVHADGSGAQVERVIRLRGNPVLLDLDEAAAALVHLEAVEGRNA